MTNIDLRGCLNAVSDVLINRPAPIRELDQIYMKAGDVLLHADHISNCFRNLDVVFIGDGDAIGLTLAHLGEKGLIASAPKSVHILDFDERIVESVKRFAKIHNLRDRVRATYYNVIDPIPEPLDGRFDAFHTNPPYGASNDGKSVEAFVRRGIEACKGVSQGCIVLADDDEFSWTQRVLANMQSFLLSQGYTVSELRPKAHQYHLDDAPNLTSCSLIVRRLDESHTRVKSARLEPEYIENFYGKGLPLSYSRVKDRTAGGRFPSRDHIMVPLNVGEEEVD